MRNKPGPENPEPKQTDLSLQTICETIVHWLNGSYPSQPAWSPEMWEQFKVVCRVHGVAQLLHENLKGAVWLDASIENWLAEQYAFNVQRMAKMHADLKAILTLFGRHDIPLMPLKGSVLSVELYEDPGRRPMADLDLLIRPEDFAGSAKLLSRLGYEQTVRHWKHTEFIQPDNRRVVSQRGEHPDNPRSVELHLYCREIFGGPTIDMTTVMWDQARRGMLLGAPAMLVEPEALWLHLLVHTTYHLWQGRGRLIHLVDLARLAPHLDDPPSLLKRVDARFIYPGLTMLHNYFPTALAEEILTIRRSEISPPFQRWIDSLDLVNTSYLNSKPAGLYFFKALKFSEGRPREVIQALRSAFLPSLQEIALDHPDLIRSRIAWLGYFFLPLDWIKRLTKRR